MTVSLLSSSLAKLAPGSLVCHDHFGLGYTLSRVQKTSADALGKVRVTFDDDAWTPDEAAGSFTGRTKTVTDADGNETATRFRFILCSFLEWDSDDETATTDEVEVTPEEEPKEVAPVDENGFDTMEGIEAETVAEEQALEEFTSFSRVKRGTVTGYRPGRKVASPIIRNAGDGWAEAEEACSHLPEDDADFAERCGQERTIAIEEAALLADFAAEFDSQ